MYERARALAYLMHALIRVRARFGKYTGRRPSEKKRQLILIDTHDVCLFKVIRDYCTGIQNGPNKF